MGRHCSIIATMRCLITIDSLMIYHVIPTQDLTTCVRHNVYCLWLETSFFYRFNGYKAISIILCFVVMWYIVFITFQWFFKKNYLIVCAMCSCRTHADQSCMLTVENIVHVHAMTSHNVSTAVSRYCSNTLSWKWHRGSFRECNWCRWKHNAMNMWSPTGRVVGWNVTASRLMIWRGNPNPFRSRCNRVASANIVVSRCVYRYKSPFRCRILLS